MKFSGLVLCSDLDGTLLDEKNQISEKNIEAIEYFRKNGGKFMIATGRVPEAVEPVIKNLSLDFPCICHNGCSIYDLKEKIYIEVTPLNDGVKNVINEIMRISPKSGVEVMTEEGIYVVNSTYATDRHLKYEKIKFFEADGIEKVPKQWIKVLFAQEPDETEFIKQSMINSIYSKKYNFSKSYKYYYEVFNKNASKGTALAKTCKEYGIDLKNVIAVGDNENDIPMLRESGMSAAVFNAPDYVKECADIVVCKNDEDAIFDLISKI